MVDSPLPSSAGAASSSDSAAAQIARNVLRQLQAACLEFCLDESEALFARVKEDIFVGAERALRADEQSILWTSYQGLVKREREFVAQLDAQFPKAMQSALDADAERALLASMQTSDTLRLLDVEDVEREVLITNAVRRLEDLCADTLAPLSHRICVLRGDSSVSISLNPFRPEVFIRAFVEAWEVFDGNRLSTRAMLRALQMQHFLPLNALYQDLNNALIERGILPQERFIIKRSASTAENGATGLWERHRRGGNESQDAVADPSGGWQFDPNQFLQQIHALVERLERRAIADGVTSEPAATQQAPDAQLLARLQQWQLESAHDDAPAVRLHTIGMAPEARAASEIDRATIEVLGRVFDFVLNDASVPAEFKALIARLQVPVLRAALINREFFLRDEHPARRLVDMLARASIGWMPKSQADDALYRMTALTVERAVREFQDDVGLFDQLCAGFQGFLEQQEQDHLSAMQARIEREAHEEALAFATAEVDKRIARRFELAPIDEHLSSFLRGPWRDVLILRCVEREREPDLWRQALETTDLLIWSVLPKVGAIERAELMRSLPGLIRTLSAGFEVIDLDAPTRAGFMDYLMKAHARVARTTTAPPAGGTAVPKRLSRDTTITDLSTPTFGGPAQRVDAGGLSRGDWCHIDLGEGGVQRYRLLWVSPLRTKYIFSASDDQSSLVKSDTEVLEMLRSGRLVRVDSTPMVQRALSAALQSGTA